jgi:excisionase family DNA binding protein
MEMASKGTDLVIDGLARIAEAVTFLGLSRSKLYELMDCGDLPYVRLGRSRRIPRRALVELAARNLTSK